MDKIPNKHFQGNAQQNEDLLRAIASDRVHLMRHVADNRRYAIVYTTISTMLVLLYWAVGLMLAGSFPDSAWIYMTIIALCLILGIAMAVAQILYRNSAGIKLSALTMLPQGELCRKVFGDFRVSLSCGLVFVLAFALPWPSLIIGYAQCHWSVAVLYAMAAAAITYRTFRWNQHTWVCVAEGISHEN